MYDRGKVLFGLAVFLLLVTLPILYNLVGSGRARAKAKTGAVPLLPAIKGNCVADRKYMRAFHMDLLNTWRNDYVRGKEDGDIQMMIHQAPDGKKYVKSLSNTCLSSGCHSNKDEFCTRCHNYAGVIPYCWECHQVPKQPDSPQPGRR